MRTYEKSGKVLDILSVHSKELRYKYERLYRILLNEQMFYTAYQHIHAKPGNMIPGTDGTNPNEHWKNWKAYYRPKKAKSTPQPCPKNIYTEKEWKTSSTRYIFIWVQIGTGGK